MQIVHVKKHKDSVDAEVGEGLLRYPKDGYTSFKNYAVPNDFSPWERENIYILTDMYYEGKAVSDCGTVKLYVDEKTKAHYKKL